MSKEEFGLTNDINEAGYIMRDGSMLDFSGKNEGGSPGQRAYDHRDVGRLGDTAGSEYGGALEYGGTDGMIEFMNSTGAIRINFDRDVFMVDISASMTEQQIMTILKIVEEWKPL